MEHLQTTEKVHDELLLHRRVDLLLRTGKLLVESLADTNRVVRNMKRTAAFLEAYCRFPRYSGRKTSHQRQLYHAYGECE